MPTTDPQTPTPDPRPPKAQRLAQALDGVTDFTIDPDTLWAEKFPDEVSRQDFRDAFHAKAAQNT